MKVRQLIRELKKFPSTHEVIITAHDNGPLEYQNIVTNVSEADFDKRRKENPDPLGDMGLKGKYVDLS